VDLFDSGKNGIEDAANRKYAGADVCNGLSELDEKDFC
jgi:hypothetical protein